MIREFKGDNRWLSSFAPVPITLDGVTYPSVEHAYQSAKSTSKLWKRLCADPKWTAGQVKQFTRELKIVHDWDEFKYDIMKECVDQKYNTEPYKTKLLNTYEYIQEGNTWGDTYWGVDLKTGEGANNLGALIMEKREQLRNENTNV